VGQVLLSYSLSSIPGVIEIVIYLILVPLLVFFFLKDSRNIIDWFKQYLPSNHGLVIQVWEEVNRKIGAYVRGRVVEIIIVGFVTSVVFSLSRLTPANSISVNSS